MTAPDLFTLQAFAAEHNVIVNDPIPDGRIHRVPTVTKPHKRNGAYLFDGERFGVMSFDEGHDRLIWLKTAGGEKQEDPARAAEWLRKRQQAADQRRDEQQRNAQRAAQRAADLLDQAEVRQHPYLGRKGFPSDRGLVADGVKVMVDGELRTFDDVLLVPMRSLAGDLVGLQRIYYDGEKFEKKYLAGTPSQGAVFRIGPPYAREQWLCEGLATGMSIKAALTQMRVDAAVVVTFSAGNLKHIAGVLRGRRLVAADNDESETGQKAAIATGLPWCMSPVLGEDCNDLHQRAGLFALASLLMKTRRAARD